VVCAQSYYERKERELISECHQTKQASTTGIIVVDWKMKFNERSSRETTVKHFGKRGISWHGMMLVYYDWSEDLNDVVRHSVYLDQILDGNSCQDGFYTVSMIEAGLKHIAKSFPNLRKGIVVFDNASC
jgi:hypothetical protein